VTLTFKDDLDNVKMNQRGPACQIYRSSSVQKLLFGHTDIRTDTHRTYCSTRTTKVIDKFLVATVTVFWYRVSVKVTSGVRTWA